MKRYVLCVKNSGYQASLVVHKIYRLLADPEASKRGLMRVVDESGEDYLYPEGMFVAIEIPKDAGRLFSAAR